MWLRCQLTLPTTPPPVLNRVATRRELLFKTSVLTLAPWAASSQKALAVQGSTAGRIPGDALIDYRLCLVLAGLSEATDAEGFYTYRRPIGKSGGHGVGWSEIVPYSFRVPPDWEEIPVSIADLGGTEIDLRFGNQGEGSLEVVVAPILRFLDIGNNANVQIDAIGSPQKVIEGFAPELFGAPLEEGDVLSTEVTTKDGIPYYTWEIKPHRLVTATATGNRAFLISITASSRQWRKSSAKLKTIVHSFHL